MQTLDPVKINPALRGATFLGVASLPRGGGAPVGDGIVFDGDRILDLRTGRVVDGKEAREMLDVMRKLRERELAELDALGPLSVRERLRRRREHDELARETGELPDGPAFEDLDVPEFMRGETTVLEEDGLLQVSTADGTPVPRTVPEV